MPNDACPRPGTRTERIPCRSVVWWSGDVSCRDMVTRVLTRIDESDPTVNAVVDVMQAESLDAASAADGASAVGEACDPLNGVPITIKVNVDVAGRPTTGGIEARRSV